MGAAAPKGSARVRTLALAGLGVWVATLGVGRCTAPDREILEAFAALRAYVLDLSRAELPRPLRQKLAARVGSAGVVYATGPPCIAVRRLDDVLDQTRELRDRFAIAEDLHNRARVLQADVLADLPEDITCPGHEDFGRPNEVEIAVSDNERLVLRLRFGDARMWSVEAGGEVFTQVSLPGFDPRPGEPGLPAVPVVRHLVAVPRGAEVSVATTPPRVAEQRLVNLWPFQPAAGDELPAFDEAFADPPFARDEVAYASDRFFPDEPCRIALVGQVRDLRLAQLACAAGRYNPVSDRLELYDEVDVEVGFDGGSGAFLTEASQNPFERPVADVADATLNGDAVFDYVEMAPAEPACLGEELIVFTPPALRPAADALATWKRKKGIATNVFDVGPATTAAEIDAFIEDRFDRCAVRPAYVLLFGDAEHVPTFYVGTLFSSQTASDYRYAVYPQLFILGLPFDILPDFGVGRISVDTLAEANAVVQKIIGYESSPPSAPAFYHNVSIASQFQCCRFDVQFASVPTQGWDQRDFVRTSELVRNALREQGYAVERIYTETVDFKYQTTGGSQIPQRYSDGTLLPEELRFPFGWNGSTQDVIDAWNAGRFLMLHRDHGSWERWSHPAFSKADVTASLTNGGLLPVVFSVNCSSGLWDNETNPGETRPLDPGSPYPSAAPPPLGGGPAVANETFFSERLLRKPDGGAIGVLAATRDSPTSANDALTRGFFDAVWPGTLPTFGTNASRRRLGDILDHGKTYLLTQSGVPQPGDPITGVEALNDLFLFHVFGDPTLEMWTSPVAFALPEEHVATLLDDRLLVSYAIEGTTITALQNTDEGLAPIGRAVVSGGVAELAFVTEPVPGVPIVLSASREGAVGRQLTPEGEMPTELEDESAFGPASLRIGFDPEEGRSPGEAVADQYAALGVHFVDDAIRTPTVEDGSGRDRATHSEPHSLLNRPDGDLLVEEPLAIRFDAPVTRVGMYVGNADAGADVVGVLTAYDAASLPIFSVSRAVLGSDVATFLGLDVGAPRIREVRLSYGLGRPEEIDDLRFE